MFHAFLRYVFGIQPLFLVLMPVASSACEKKDMQPAYMFVLRHHLEQLVNESENHGHECRQNNTKELICNTAQTCSHATQKCRQRPEACQKSSVLCRIKKIISKFKSCWIQYMNS
ncbi:interleukin-7 isoform X3 [Eublepharis macularius]|uniref:Interleukin-7 isoform X3 n=1 Tax=Eublepharis macularius TaxID=481883 RepID=A0AA97L2Z4_EUBMA|nr:interleukin-7 isoform X3 [Eublepharis macularius]